MELMLTGFFGWLLALPFETLGQKLVIAFLSSGLLMFFLCFLHEMKKIKI